VNAAICDHKDCERTDATPVHFEHWSRDGEVLDDSFTYYFCLDHRLQLHELKRAGRCRPRSGPGSL
jgi:hypothetical protein